MSRRIAIVGARPPTRAEHSDAPDIYVSIECDIIGFVSRLPPGTTIVSGGANGADAKAAECARHRGFALIEHLPDYTKHGRRAPLVRNSLIVDDSDEVHAWPAPWSRGTWDTIRKAEAVGKPCVVHEPWREVVRSKAGGGDG